MIGFNIAMFAKTMGKILDKFIEENEVILQIKLPENSMDVVVTDNLGMSAVLRLHIMLCALSNVLIDVVKDCERLGGVDIDKLIDDLSELVKRDIKDKEGK